VAGAHLVLVRSMPRRNPTRAELVTRLFALEILPLVGALTYSYFHPRMLLIALSVYSVCALTNSFLSIRDGVALGVFGMREERTEDRYWFWYWVIRPALFPILILCIAIAAVATNTLVWPPH
jgi:hypothetical protein